MVLVVRVYLISSICSPVNWVNSKSIRRMDIQEQVQCFYMKSAFIQCIFCQLFLAKKCKCSNSNRMQMQSISVKKLENINRMGSNRQIKLFSTRRKIMYNDTTEVQREDC